MELKTIADLRHLIETTTQAVYTDEQAISVAHRTITALRRRLTESLPYSNGAREPRPCIAFRAEITTALGGGWIAQVGDNYDVKGYGPTPALAMKNFDIAWEREDGEFGR